MRNAFIVVMLILALLVVGGCSASKMAEQTTDTTAQAAPVVTGDETVDSAVAPVIEDTSDVELGEMI